MKVKNFLNILIICTVIGGFFQPLGQVQAQAEHAPEQEEIQPASNDGYLKCYVQVSYKEKVEVTTWFGLKRTMTMHKTGVLAFIGKEDGSLDPGLTIRKSGDRWISNAYPYANNWSTGQTVIPAKEFKIVSWGCIRHPEGIVGMNPMRLQVNHMMNLHGEDRYVDWFLDEGEGYSFTLREAIVTLWALW